MGPIFLIGYRCTGKTSTGKYLADLLNKTFLDTDLVLE
ncbi:MAG: shikimate kinase AroL, partial [Desulfobacter sp.]